MLLLILLEEVRCIPKPLLSELYVVKSWAGMEQSSLSCHTTPKAWHGFCVPFLVVLYLQYCMLEDSSTNCEMCDIYICARGTCDETLAGRNHIGTELLMSAL